MQKCIHKTNLKLIWTACKWAYNESVIWYSYVIEVAEFIKLKTWFLTGLNAVPCDIELSLADSCGVICCRTRPSTIFLFALSIITRSRLARGLDGERSVREGRLVDFRDVAEWLTASRRVISGSRGPNQTYFR